jgi:hypothetical protein
VELGALEEVARQQKKVRLPLLDEREHAAET